jgi:hypothetical protein
MYDEISKRNKDEQGRYAKNDTCPICGDPMAHDEGSFHQDYECHAGHDDFAGSESGIVCDHCLDTVCKVER